MIKSVADAIAAPATQLLLAETAEEICLHSPTPTLPRSDEFLESIKRGVRNAGEKLLRISHNQRCPKRHPELSQITQLVEQLWAWRLPARQRPSDLPMRQAEIEAAHSSGYATREDVLIDMPEDSDAWRFLCSVERQELPGQPAIGRIVRKAS
jgi:hypothetical protein